MKHLERAYTGNNFMPWYIVVIVIIFVAQIVLSIIPLAFLDIINPSILDRTEGILNTELFNSFDKNILFLIIFIPFPFLLLLFAWLTKAFHKRTIIEVMNGREKIRWNKIWAGFSFWVIIMLILESINYFLFPDDFILQFNLSKFIPLVLLSLTFIPLQAAFEEVVFRGYLIQGIGILTQSRWVALLVSSFAFATLHMDNPEVDKYGSIMFFNYLAMALIYAIITILDDGLEIALGMHTANNIFISLFITERNSAFETDAIFEVTESDPYTSLVMLAITGLIAIAFFYKKYNWSFSSLFKKIEKPTNTTASIS